MNTAINVLFNRIPNVNSCILNFIHRLHIKILPDCNTICISFSHYDLRIRCLLKHFDHWINGANYFILQSLLEVTALPIECISQYLPVTKAYFCFKLFGWNDLWEQCFAPSHQKREKSRDLSVLSRDSEWGLILLTNRVFFVILNNIE